MNSAIVVVGLALVLAVQIAIHLRIAGIPARIAAMKQVAEGRARPEADAFQEALARRLNLIVRGIQGYHDQIAEDFRAQVAAGEQRARLAEAKRGDATSVAPELRALARDMAVIAAELRALQGDFAELVSQRGRGEGGAPPSAVQGRSRRRRRLCRRIRRSARRSRWPRPRAARRRPRRVRRPRTTARTTRAGTIRRSRPSSSPRRRRLPFSSRSGRASSSEALPRGLRAPRRERARPRHALRPPPPPYSWTEGDDAMERPLDLSGRAVESRS